MGNKQLKRALREAFEEAVFEFERVRESEKHLEFVIKLTGCVSLGKTISQRIEIMITLNENDEGEWEIMSEDGPGREVDWEFYDETDGTVLRAS